ncbi:MAG: hypothetical protein ABIR70_20375 [Bryobacteraceae bacterium]
MAVLKAKILGRFFVGGDCEKVVRLENLVTGQAAHVVNAIAAHHEFSFGVLTDRHSADSLILRKTPVLSSPLFCGS